MVNVCNSQLSQIIRADFDLYLSSEGLKVTTSIFDSLIKGTKQQSSPVRCVRHYQARARYSCLGQGSQTHCVQTTQFRLRRLFLSFIPLIFYWSFGPYRQRTVGTCHLQQLNSSKQTRCSRTLVVQVGTSSFPTHLPVVTPHPSYYLPSSMGYDESSEVSRQKND